MTYLSGGTEQNQEKLHARYPVLQTEIRTYNSTALLVIRYICYEMGISPLKYLVAVHITSIYIKETEQDGSVGNASDIVGFEVLTAAFMEIYVVT
jgi:hypothetical protein